MSEVHVVRHKVLVEGRSLREVARELGLSRNTVKRYLTRAAPTRTEASPRPRPRWELIKARLRELLETSPQWTGGKQRLTATRLHELLVGEGHEVGVTLVKAAVAEWKRERREVFVPLVYPPGELAQVDFFEVLVDVDEKRQKAHLFVMRLMSSGRDFVWLYERQDQLSFLDGHVRAFAQFGAVPQRIAYDNLRAAVTKILIGSERQLAPRFEAMASHYLFEPLFCRPRTGHDKGGVEARGRGIRWQHLVPIPSAKTLHEIRIDLLGRVEAKHDVAKFVVERAQMLPLALQPFDARRVSFVTASRSALVKVEGALYSVPSRWSGLEVTVRLGSDDVELVGPSGSVHHRRRRFGERSIDYRHYISELATKPQAVRQVACELLRDLGEPYVSAWRHLVDLHGPKQASRVFAKILGYVEVRGFDAVSVRLQDALRADEPLLLALAPVATPSTQLEQEAVPRELRDLTIGSGSAADYDAWLRGGGA